MGSTVRDLGSTIKEVKSFLLTKPEVLLEDDEDYGAASES